MKVLKFDPIPEEYFKSIDYPIEGNTSDIVVVSEEEAENYYKAAQECFKMLDEAADYAIKNKRLGELGIPEYAWSIIEQTFSDASNHPHMVGRFDFAGGLDGLPIKLMEFNGDTPFSIFEVSSIQYAVAKYHNLDPDKYQYNTLFESLIEYFVYLFKTYNESIGKLFHNPNHGIRVCFTNSEDREDDLNTQILYEAANEAIEMLKSDQYYPIDNKYYHWTDIGVDKYLGLVNVKEDNLGKWFADTSFNIVVKMVPWDLLFLEDEKMCKDIINAMEEYEHLRVINPPYAAVYQSKGLLKIANELFPDSPYLLGYSDVKPPEGIVYIAKPIYGREGCNIDIVNEDGNTISSDGYYKDQPKMYQEKAELNFYEGKYYQAGVFVSMEYPCGLGFRRSESPIISTYSELCGHIVEH